MTPWIMNSGLVYYICNHLFAVFSKPCYSYLSMKLQFFKNWSEKFQLVLVRFPLSLICVVGISILCILKIHDYKVNIHEYLWPLFIGGLFLSISASLWLEDVRNKVVAILLNVSVIAVWVIYCVSLPSHLQLVTIYRIVVLSVVFVLSAFFMAFLKRDNEMAFWNFTYRMVVLLLVTYLFSSILMSGLSLALFSIHELFQVEMTAEIYQYLSVFCFVLFAPVYFLGSIPYATEKYGQQIQFNKVLRILGLFILVPILCVYLVILYAYMFQIVVHWQLPNGWVSTLVSALGLGSFLTIMILYPLRVREENKAVNLLSKYFPLILLPLLVLMFVAIVRRLDDYGLTMNRFYILILNLWMFGVCVWMFLSKPKRIKWIAISFALVAFLSSVGPWSIGNITQRYLQHGLQQHLADLHLLDNGRVARNTKLVIIPDTSLQNIIAGQVSYLYDHYGVESLQYLFAYPIVNLSKENILDHLVMNRQKQRIKPPYFCASLLDDCAETDIAPFHHVLLFRIFNRNRSVQDNGFVISIAGSVLKIQSKQNNRSEMVISLKNKMKDLWSKGSNSDHNEMPINEMSVTGQKYKLVIKALSGEYYLQNDSAEIRTLNGLLFY